MMELFLNLVYPKYCLLCLQKGDYICDNCKKKFTYFEKPICPVCLGVLRSKNYFIHKICRIHSPLDGLFPLIQYDEIARLILTEAKYKFGKEILYEIAKMLKCTYSNLPFSIDYLVPVPMNKIKFEKRGFNQAEVIAQKINRNYKNVLIKINSTTSQASLNRNKRLLNLKNSFLVNKNFNVQNKNIVLIDDVSTTGATLFECAKVLKLDGAKRVYAITWAKDL